MAARLNLIGDQYGRLTVVKLVKNRGDRRMWECVCICGKTSIASTGDLRSGNTTSCGCYNREKTAESNRTTHPSRKHGQKGSGAYKSWQAMLQRCEYKASVNYPHYGGRGITVCERWHDFILFFQDMGIRPRGMQLDRINNDQGYFPGNVRWVTPRQNSNNKRSTRLITVGTETRSLSEWSRTTGVKVSTISERLSRGWDNARAVGRC